MPAPTFRQIKQNPQAYPDWMICRTCRGDRRKVVFTTDDSQLPAFEFEECPICEGARVISSV